MHEEPNNNNVEKGKREEGEKTPSKEKCLVK